MDKIISSSGVGFTHGQHQDIVQMLNHIESRGKTVGEYKAWVKQKVQEDKSRKQAEEEYIKKLPECPKCQSNMWPYPVNTGQRDQIGGNYKTQFICGNPDCMHEEYSEEEIVR